MFNVHTHATSSLARCVCLCDGHTCGVFAHFCSYCTTSTTHTYAFVSGLAHGVTHCFSTYSTSCATLPLMPDATHARLRLGNRVRGVLVRGGGGARCWSRWWCELIDTLIKMSSNARARDKHDTHRPRCVQSHAVCVCVFMLQQNAAIRSQTYPTSPAPPPSPQTLQCAQHSS